MLSGKKIWVGTSDQGQPVYLLPQMANRHGLIAGATGTGKTVTLKLIAEGFSQLGVPVFLGDIKGDLSGMVLPGENNEKIANRLQKAGAPAFQPETYPTVFWDVYGRQGHPIRTTVHEMGLLLLARMLGLNETQEGVLNILFRVANNRNLLLVTLQDLKAMLVHVGENASQYTLEYGNVSKASIGAIQRAVAMLEDQGGDLFFGQPALNLQDWMQCAENGRGYLNILACDKLFLNPRMYSTFLLWMLSELYETLPEIGDLEKPRMVFFFDEAHLLFDDCSRQLMDKIEQIVRLIRSKGVGVYFITQNPTDVPMTVLGQLGNRVQHALRAYTPLDQKAVKVAAQTFRVNPDFDTEEVITQLRTGEALLSFLDENGAPGVVERATILPPQSFMGAIDEATRKAVIQSSPFYGVYEPAVDDGAACDDTDVAEAAAMTKEASVPMTNIPDPMNNMAQATAPVQQAAPQPAQPVFMVYDPTTGGYAAQQISTMNAVPVQQPAAVQQTVMAQQPVVMQQPAPVQQPVMAQQPVAAQQPVPASQAFAAQQQTAQPQTIQQNVLVQDPATGMYVQKLMTLAYNPAIGQYVPVQTEEEAKAAAAAKAKAEKEAAAAAKAAEKAEKERAAEERRQRADELREERAERARANDSVLGRVKNTAISSATRNITTKLTNSLYNLITGKKK